MGAGEEARKEAGEGEDGEGVGGKEEKAAVSCSICLDAVVAGGGGRSTARLQCGHEFHLDCIGSAFNAKGVMQCPNCRKIEKGNWLYANGSRPAQDVNMDEWAHDEDLYDVSYSEMPFRFHWCPFGRLAQLPSFFEEGESSPPVTFHDFMGQHVFTEHVAAVSAAPGAAHPCPYVAYLHPLPSLASSSSSHVPERTMDGPAYHDPWHPLAGPSDGRPLQSVQPADFHHNHWAHVPNSYPQPNNNNGVAEQQGVPFGTMRAARVDGDTQRRGSSVSPSYFSNGSGSRSRAPNVPPMVPQFMRAHGGISEQYQQNSSSSLFAGAHRSGGMRTAPPPLPENPAFCLFPPGSSGHNSMETDDAGGSRFYAWERDRFAPYPLMPVDCETNWWSSQQSHGTSEPTPAPRRLFGQWIGVGRSSPENRSPEGSSYRQMHTPRM
uniref:RING-type domain-containing protein n=1 Tax=Oryza brachyantha TaxID=4533 RepID=J3M432_ORYBR